MAALALAGASSASASSAGAAGLSGASAGTPTPAAGAPQTNPSGITGSSPSACTAAPTATASSGGASVGGASAPSSALPCPNPMVPGTTAQIIHGLAYAPADAPLQVQEAIWAGDRIRLKPYRVGGGHGRWNDTAYDCSGAVSYVLHAAGLLKTSMDSSGMESWGHHGAGQWITVYTNPAHAFVEIAGIRFDTSAEDDPNPPPGTGPRWRPLMTSTAGFMARHMPGL